MKRRSSIKLHSEAQSLKCQKTSTRPLNPRSLKILNSVLSPESPSDITTQSVSSYIVQTDGCLVPQNDKENTINYVSGTPKDIILSKDGLLTQNVNFSSECCISPNIAMFEDIMQNSTYFDDNNIIDMDVPQRPYDINQDLLSLDDVSSISKINIHNTANTEGQELITLNPNIVTNQELHNEINHNTIDIIENIDLSNDPTIITEITKEHQRINTISVITHPVTQETLTATTETVSSLSEEVRQKRFRKSQPSTWQTKINQKNREKGKSYFGKKKADNKWKYSEQKPERTIKERCKCKLSLKGGTKLECSKLSQEERQKIFKKFWNLDWKEKKVFVKTTSICKETERKRGNSSSSRRKNSVELYLSNSCGDRYRVCKTMFLNTLSIGEWVIKKWIIRDTDLSKVLTKNNMKKEENNKLITFFKNLPKVESHYCRKDTSKLYLEPIWTSKAQLYKFYVADYCSQEQSNAMSLSTFCSTFDQLNLSLFRPKKDLCDLCEGFKTGNVTELKYRDHIIKKEEARNEKDRDKNSEHEVLTMDLQSVLLSPKSNVSALYYKTKLIVHNFTIYDLKRKKGYCFIWNESEGSVTANEFSTIIITMLHKFIVDYPLKSNQEIIIYSDGCTYQNRNSILSNALINFSMENKVVVVQKYLEKGHTQMECDSMHATIERCCKNKKINVPADYTQISKMACTKNPYEVQYLYHHFFKKMENTLTFFKSIRPGKKSGDPVVTDLRGLKYSPDGKIQFKLRHASTHWEDLPIRTNKMDFIPFKSIPQLYNARLKIKAEKYQHLQELKKTMEKDYHNFYDILPHY